jgi:hypothetical protein
MTPFIVLSLIAVVAACLWPRFGLLALWQHYRQARQRALVEDALKHLHACE